MFLEKIEVSLMVDVDHGSEFFFKKQNGFIITT